MTRTTIASAAALTAALLLPLPGQAKPAEPIAVQGPARVIDGDTLEVDGHRIRLHGIDAPEIRQRCDDAHGEAWPCGRRAAAALATAIRATEIECAGRGRDRYRRLVAVCRAGGLDVGRWMVAQGMAIADRRFGRGYAGDEEAARTAALGVWVGQPDMPWDWRRSRRGG